ncbi:MAG: fructose-6-phosphate aldolase [Pseudomonadota bacterium]
MKIFIDTADIAEIKEAVSMGVVDGVTTNPTLIAKTGRKSKDVLAEICAATIGPVSAEALALDSEPMVEEARDLAKIAPNIVVKIPMTVAGLRAAKTLAEESIKTNMTLCFSANQALLAAKAGATYVSPFVGRVDDIGDEGMSLISDVMTIYENYGFDTEVIVASIRNPVHVLQAARMGAHVATIPLAVIRQLMQHPLTDIGIQRFLADWEKVPQ